jgi:thioredoxin 1
VSTPVFPVIDDTSFESEVAAASGLVVLEFWNEGCVPCKQLSRVLTELAPGLPTGVRIATVDAAENPALAQRFNVRSVPTLVFLKDGAEVERRTGVDRKQVIKKIVETHA